MTQPRPLASPFLAVLRKELTDTLRDRRTLVAMIVVPLLLFPVQMPPPPGRSVGYPLLVAVDPTLYGATLLAMLALATLASAAVARRTVTTPIVDALAHV